MTQQNFESVRHVKILNIHISVFFIWFRQTQLQMPHVPQTVEQQMERRQQGEISEVKLHLVGMIFFKEKKKESLLKISDFLSFIKPQH